MEYLYCAEKLINGTIVDLYRKNAAICEKYSIDNNSWNESKDAYRAFEGGSYTVKMTTADAENILRKWQDNFRLINLIDRNSDKKIYHFEYEVDVNESGQ